MNELNFICENYKACFDREMCLPKDRQCPHVVPHDHYPACDWECDKEERHCEEFILKGD